MPQIELISALESPAQALADAIIDRPVILFSGQGTQQKGMGKDLAEADREAMDLWKEGERLSGLPLRGIYWEGNDEDINDTRAVQPALTITNLNLWRAFSQKHYANPMAAAGHSLGEFAALAAAKVLTFRETLEAVSLRGRLMAEADPKGTGAMAAIIKLDAPSVEQIIAEVTAGSGEILVAANYNTPEQTVISGAKTAVDAACKKARELKGRSVGLQVKGAFHSPLMEEANKEFHKLLDKLSWRKPEIPVYSNASGKALATGQQVKESIWKQMISPVYWVNLIRNLYLAGVRWWMEISPRAVLGKMLGPSVAGLAGHCDAWRVDLVNSLSSILNYVS